MEFGLLRKTCEPLKGSRLARFVVPTLILSIFGGIGGAAKGMENNMASTPHVDVKTEATLGDARVDAIDFRIPDERITGYFVHVDGSTVEGQAQLATATGKDEKDLFVSKSMTFDGDVLVQICQKATDLHIDYDAKKHTASATIPASAINNCAETDLRTRNFTPGNDYGNIPIEAWTAAWKATEKHFPYITNKIPFAPKAVAVKDGIDSKLQNLAQIQGEEQAVKKCSAKVWESDKFRKTYRDRMADIVLMYLSLDPKVVRDHVAIYVGKENAKNPDLPDQGQLFPNDTDYTTYIKKLNNVKGLDLGTTKIGGDCKLAPGIENANQPKSTPSASPTGGKR